MNAAADRNAGACPAIRYQLPDKPPSAVVLLAHGLGEHSGCFEHWAALFVDAGYAVALFDWHGHGRSSGKRGHASLSLLRKNLADVVATVRANHPQPLFLYAHSMGALVALSWLSSRETPPPLQGVIAASPWLRLRHSPPMPLVRLALMLAKIVPSLTVRTGIKAEELNIYGSDKSTATDPLLHKRISLGLFGDLWREGRRLAAEGIASPVPLLLMYGAADRLMDVSSDESLIRLSSGMDSRAWQGLGHDLHHELLYLDVFQFVNNWIKQQTYDNRTFQNAR
jgi:alpha-beta hydrolase superfamily lysophospholipase